jgi:hypothetical protein
LHKILGNSTFRELWLDPDGLEGLGKERGRTIRRKRRIREMRIRRIRREDKEDKEEEDKGEEDKEDKEDKEDEEGKEDKETTSGGCTVQARWRKRSGTHKGSKD